MKISFEQAHGGVNIVSYGNGWSTAMGAEIIGTFGLVYVVLSSTDPKRCTRDSHIPVSNIYHMRELLD